MATNALLALLCGAACGFNASGLGTASGGVVGHDGTGSSTGDVEGSSSAGTDQADADATAGPDTAGEPSSSGPDGDGTTGPGVDPCANPMPFTVEIEASQAVLSGPMQLGVSMSEGTYAFSEVAGQGRASFEFQLPCEAEVRAWARVYDPGVGADALGFGDPDSFFVAFDAQSDTAWWYGCQTADAGLFGGAWAWPTLSDNPYCIGDQFRRTLSPGTHLLHLTNREAGNIEASRVAAVARVVVSTDPGFSP